MIIQCPKCETKFRVPEHKVAQGGVKVRCSKCAHVFVVRKDPQSLETIAGGVAPPDRSVGGTGPSRPTGAPEASSFPPSSPTAAGPVAAPLPGAVGEPFVPNAAHALASPAASADVREDIPTAQTRVSSGPFGGPPAPSDDLSLPSEELPGPKSDTEGLFASLNALPPASSDLSNGLVGSQKDPFGWGTPASGSEGGTDLGLGQPPRAAFGALPPPLPPSGSSPGSMPSPLGPAGFAGAGSQSADPDADRFPPPPALTGDLASSEPQPDDAWESPLDAFSADPFADLPRDPEPSQFDTVEDPAPTVPDSPEPAAEAGQGVRLALGRVAPLTPYRSSDLDVPLAHVDPAELRPPPPVSKLRWPPRVGFVLGLVLAFVLGADWGLLPEGGKEGALEDVRLVAFEVHPYPTPMATPVWVASGAAETRVRPYPEGVEVVVKAKVGDRVVASTVGLLDVHIPEPRIVQGTAAVDAYLQAQSPPPIPAAARRRFVAVMRAPQVEASVDFDVEFRRPSRSSPEARPDSDPEPARK